MGNGVKFRYDPVGEITGDMSHGHRARDNAPVSVIRLFGEKVAIVVEGGPCDDEFYMESTYSPGTGVGVGIEVTGDERLTELTDEISSVISDEVSDRERDDLEDGGPLEEALETVEN